MNGGFIDQPVEAYVEKVIKNAYIFSYMIEGRIAGFIAYYCNDPSCELAFLTMLCIDPGYAGKGIGKHLLNCSITDIKNKGFHSYVLEVKKDNLPAIQLYKNAGFEITGEDDHFCKMKKVIKHES